MPPPEYIPSTGKPKGDDDRRERSTRSRRQRRKSADRKRAEKEAEIPTPRTGPMKSADAWPPSEPSESAEPARKLDLEQISPEKFTGEGPPLSRNPISELELFQNLYPGRLQGERMPHPRRVPRKRDPNRHRTTKQGRKTTT